MFYCVFSHFYSEFINFLAKSLLFPHNFSILPYPSANFFIFLHTSILIFSFFPYPYANFSLFPPIPMLIFPFSPDPYPALARAGGGDFFPQSPPCSRMLPTDPLCNPRPYTCVTWIRNLLESVVSLFHEIWSLSATPLAPPSQITPCPISWHRVVGRSPLLRIFHPLYPPG